MTSRGSFQSQPSCNTMASQYLMIILLSLESTPEILNPINLIFPQLCMLTLLLVKETHFGKIINSSAVLAQLSDSVLMTDTSASLCHTPTLRGCRYCSA